VLNHKATFRKIFDLNHAKELITNIGCDPNSISIMAPKMIHYVIRLENIHLQDAIIIKQDMLSIGGEVAVPKHTFKLDGEPSPILISGTLQQLLLLVEKLSRHYLRIKNIALEINELLKSIK
jgi:dihydropteroate synthase